MRCQLQRSLDSWRIEPRADPGEILLLLEREKYYIQESIARHQPIRELADATRKQVFDAFCRPYTKGDRRRHRRLEPDARQIGTLDAPDLLKDVDQGRLQLTLVRSILFTEKFDAWFPSLLRRAMCEEIAKAHGQPSKDVRNCLTPRAKLQSLPHSCARSALL